MMLSHHSEPDRLLLFYGRAIPQQSCGLLDEACGAGLALFLPSVEYSYPVSDRISLAAELSMPIANDWYSDWNHDSNAKSLMLSVGSVIVF